MPDLTGTSTSNGHETACKNKRCQSLAAAWRKDVLEGSSRSWEERCAEECSVCAEHRRARCCVRVEGNRWTTDADNIPQKFEAAPLINIFNEPKYHASILRARKYAETKKQILLWLIALDKPTHPDHTALSEEALKAKKTEWLRLHDQKTGGIMGCLPLVKDLPLRLTETKHSEKEKSLIKNRRCKLYGWTLHEEDKKRLETWEGREMVLNHQPEELYIHFPTATWTWAETLDQGIISITPSVVDWYLDQKMQVRVRRKGFTVVSDLSGTAHSFAGETLDAAYVDCLSWDAPPTRDLQLAGYMSLSRVESIENICVTQAFSPQLFSQGDLPGPEILLKFQRNEIQQHELENAWASRRTQKKRRTLKWPQDMLLYCRGCSERLGEETERPLSEFPEATWKTIALGMERFCTSCLKSKQVRRKLSEESMAQTPKADDDAKQCKEMCAHCNSESIAVAFREQRLCEKCAKIEIKCTTCSSAKKEIKLALCFFDIEQVLQWKKTRNMNRARCRSCVERQPARAASYKFQQTLYECSECSKKMAPGNFDRKALQKLEECKELYLARCVDCRPETDKDEKTFKGRDGKHNRWVKNRASGKHELLVKCKFCHRELPDTAYSLSWRSHKNYSQWACKECDETKLSGKSHRWVKNESSGTKELFVKCKSCLRELPETQYRLTLWKLKDYSKWACKECEHPPCSICGVKRIEARIGTYVCKACAPNANKK